MNAYETVIVVDPSLDESGVEKKLEKLAEVVKRNNGRMAAIDRWGRRKMSYPINNRHEGTYVCLQFFAEAGAPKDLTRVIQLDEHILRHLIVRGHIQTISAEPAAAEPAARPEPGPAGPPANPPSPEHRTSSSPGPAQAGRDPSAEGVPPPAPPSPPDAGAA
ncbi:MAG TPA: 30S ribosomal protein S6 [candidate division Zixibacteria bacterium]|nr:30S ribosomal protein S6 [candidate division Zixibacteria bacterium]